MPIELFEDYYICIQKMDAEDKEMACIGDFNCDWLSIEKKISHYTRLALLS